MSNFSSEAIKAGVVPPAELKGQELQDWISKNIDPDSMGFDGGEGTPTNK